MKQQSVSVIMPSYNCGRFIGEAIGSIRAQTVAPEQIIVVDDGSTDDTEQVVRGFDDPRILYIKQPNSGVASARNVGLNAARCDFVTFLDADDRWRPHFIERMSNFLIAVPTVSAAFANFVRFNHGSGELMSDQFRLYPRELRHPFGHIPQRRAFTTLVACGEIPGYTQTMMFRRSLIDGVRFPPLALGDDSNFALQTFLRGDVAFTDEVLAEIRRHDTNSTRDYREMVVHTLAGLKLLAPHVTGESNIAAYRDRLIRAHVNAALYQTLTGRMRSGLRDYRDGLRVPGAWFRKIKGSLRMALAIPRALLH
jgi:glycosyltransferase involved in cell wall biosynthesis